MIKKANENAGALQELGDHLLHLTEAILEPLNGKEEADIPSGLGERIETLTK